MNTFASLLAAAEAGYASTTGGSSISDGVSSMNNNLLLPWVFSFIAVLYDLKYDIAFVVILGTVIFFAYRAWKVKGV